MRCFFMLLMMMFPSFLWAGQLDREQKLDAGYILKEITVPQGEDRALVLVNTVIDASPGSVWDALVDIGSWPRWLPMTKDAAFLSEEAAAMVTPEIAKERGKVLEIRDRFPLKEGPSGWRDHWVRVAYEEYDLPWPIRNEWVVRRYTYDIHKDFARASWKRIDSTRESNDGYWDVKVWKDGRTYLTYCYRVKPKENVPEAVFKTAVSMTVNSMIKALRHEAQRREMISAATGPGHGT